MTRNNGKMCESFCTKKKGRCETPITEPLSIFWIFRLLLVRQIELARVLILQACAMTRMIVPGTINSLKSCPQFALAIRGIQENTLRHTNPSQKSQFCSLRSPKRNLTQNRFFCRWFYTRGSCCRIHLEKRTLRRELRKEEHHAASKLAQAVRN